jgi:uncharacterized OB-fold protein
VHDRFPLPDPADEATAPYYAGAAAGEVRIPRCDACDAWCWYPSRTCAACGGSSFTWTATSGRGRLFSWAVVRRGFLPAFADKAPFVSALVALEEDPSVRLVTEIVDCDPEALVPDLPVRADFRPLRFTGVDGEVMAPFFVLEAPT